MANTVRRRCDSEGRQRGAHPIRRRSAEPSAEPFAERGDEPSADRHSTCPFAAGGGFALPDRRRRCSAEPGSTELARVGGWFDGSRVNALGTARRWAWAEGGLTARPPSRSAADEVRIVLAVLRGEVTIVGAARRAGVSRTSIANWRDQFFHGGQHAVASGGATRPTSRERQLAAENGFLGRREGLGRLRARANRRRPLLREGRVRRAGGIEEAPSSRPHPPQGPVDQRRDRTVPRLAEEPAAPPPRHRRRRAVRRPLAPAAGGTPSRQVTDG